MTTDLDERVTRALAARADALTVTRPPLDDVLAGAGPAPAPGGGGRRHSAWLVAAAVLAVVLGVAAVVVATRPTADDGRVDLRPVDEAPTTTEPPVLVLGYMPDDLPAAPVEAVSSDGLTTVRTHTAGERVLEVTVTRATRSPALEDALDARRTGAIVAAYADGGSVPTGTDPPPSPLADALLGAPAALPDRPGAVVGDVQPGDDPLLVVTEVLPGTLDPIDVGLVAFRAGAEVRVAGRGLRLDEALAVLAGIDGPGLAPRSRPAEDPITAAPLPAGTPFLRPVATVLPEGWVLGSIWGLGGGLGGEDVVAGGSTEGATLSTSGYGPLGRPVVPEDVVFAAGPAAVVTLSRTTPLPAQQEALDSGDEEAIIDAYGGLDFGLWASGGEARVLHADRAPVLVATGIVDGTTVGGTPEPVELTTAVVVLGPDLQLEVQAQGLTEGQLLALVRGVRIVG